MSINDTTVTVVGNLTADPELKFSNGGTSWVKFTVAATPRVFDRASNTYRDGDALFMNCTAFRQLAENIAESLHKGDRVVATGRLKQNRWETPEGEKRSSIGLDVEEIGPSLKFAVAHTQKMNRRSTSGEGTADPWQDPAGASAEPGW